MTTASPGDPAWVEEARLHIGMREVPGAPTAPTIARWLQGLNAWWTDDETPWCGTFVAHCMRANGIAPPKAWYRAKAWADWGEPVAPCRGAVVVFERQGGGHVGLLVGKSIEGRIMVLGGNQGNAVNVMPFDLARVIAYRWPVEAMNVARTPPPVMYASGPVSANEA